uniref:Uncharacterized protein n=1 Tax=Triticum urartu TaxID=4572 RepID=A0A8R7QTR9_TRIUA
KKKTPSPSHPTNPSAPGPPPTSRAPSPPSLPSSPTSPPPPRRSHPSRFRSDPAARARAPPPAPPRLPEDVRRSSFARPGGLSLRPPSQGRRARPAVGASPPPPSPLAPRRRLRPSPSSAPLGNEHWKDLVVTVRDDVLIPRPETEAVVDMVATTDYERGSWSCPSSSSAAALRFGSIAVPCVDVSISFTDRRLHEVGRRGLEFMPFLLSLSVFLFGTSWFIYALLGLDPFIFDLILVENIGAKLVRLKILRLVQLRPCHPHVVPAAASAPPTPPPGLDFPTMPILAFFFLFDCVLT